MKERKFARKLSVSRETIQRLEVQSLREVLGAYTMSTCSCIQGCAGQSATCPP